jgi:hypothetical protein
MHPIAIRTTKNMYFPTEQSEQEVEQAALQGSIQGSVQGSGLILAGFGSSECACRGSSQNVASPDSEPPFVPLILFNFQHEMKFGAADEAGPGVASSACVSCKERKQKCDKALPNCSRCERCVLAPCVRSLTDEIQ